MLTQLRIAIIATVVLTLICAVAYPLAVTGVAQAVFHRQANGSMITQDGTVVGSALIGQDFTDPKYFWGRPSATSVFPYNAAASSGSNFGPSSPALVNEVQAAVNALHAADPANTSPIPVDLVTSSASGLDPDISPAAAQYQLHRVAQARGMTDAQVQTLVTANTQGRQFGILGEARVNVLQLNLALDALK